MVNFIDFELHTYFYLLFILLFILMSYVELLYLHLMSIVNNFYNNSNNLLNVWLSSSIIKKRSLKITIIVCTFGEIVLFCIL